MTRIVVSLLAGFAITISLFWLMQYMISNNQQGFKQTEDIHLTEFVRIRQESQTQTKKRAIPEKPKLPERPSTPKMQTQSMQQPTQTKLPVMDMPNLDIPLQKNNFSASVLSGVQVANTNADSGTISSNVIPLLRIPPNYPRRAASRRIEGWVKVEFTITKDGTVTDAVVVAAQPSSIFNREALKAIKRWKFKPHVVEGEAHEQRAVQVLEFKLSQ